MLARQANGAWMLLAVSVCDGVCTTSAGLAGQPNGAWMLLRVVCVGVGVCVSQNSQPAMGRQGNRTVLGCY